MKYMAINQQTTMSNTTEEDEEHDTNPVQILVVLRRKDKDVYEENLVQVAVAKQSVGNNIFVVSAIGYAGGGVYETAYAVVMMDAYDEEVDDILCESSVTEDLDVYAADAERLMEALFWFLKTDDDEGFPTLKEEYWDYLSDDGDPEVFEQNWDWDNEAHVEASKNWGITYRW
jgi:hypothetical protein